MTIFPDYLPNSLGLFLFGFGFALLLAPIFPGIDIGPIRIPRLPHSKRILSFSGGTILAIVLAMFLVPLSVLSPTSECPFNFDEHKGTTKMLKCACTKDLLGASITGSYVYTYDSNLCLAAKHVGLFTDTDERKV